MLVDADIRIDHAVTAEPLHRHVTNCPPVELTDSRNCLSRRSDVRYERARRAVDDEFRHRTSVEGDHWSATRHGFHDREPERLVKVNQMKKGQRAPEEGRAI